MHSAFKLSKHQTCHTASGEWGLACLESIRPFPLLPVMCQPQGHSNFEDALHAQVTCLTLQPAFMAGIMLMLISIMSPICML